MWRRWRTQGILATPIPYSSKFSWFQNFVKERKIASMLIFVIKFSWLNFRDWCTFSWLLPIFVRPRLFTYLLKLFGTLSDQTLNSILETIASDSTHELWGSVLYKRISEILWISTVRAVLIIRWLDESGRRRRARPNPSWSGFHGRWRGKRLARTLARACRSCYNSHTSCCQHTADGTPRREGRG